VNSSQRPPWWLLLTPARRADFDADAAALERDGRCRHGRDQQEFMADWLGEALGRRTSSFQAAVERFHCASGLAVGAWPAIRDAELRARLIEEEAAEAAEAIRAGDLPAALKELCDLLYVTFGAGVTFGVELTTPFTEVHAANMSKLPFTQRADGKVLKGPNYRPPDMPAVVARLHPPAGSPLALSSL
jgi:NTP pyrophosphatase (non-canonical NTP hydrolase)